ncbi:MAG: autotransporter outer membrane beta-barrel domain-containing protein [Deltaproteobacteria bacterium]|nr:autotransporter outer membrane beta-barrel domain-containing protein [Deltaproteobacteria bacterium]
MADITLGAFFEYGSGSYDTYNSYANLSDVHADGDVDFVGGGILTRFDFGKSEKGTTYVEAAARFGRSTNEYASNDFTIPVRFNMRSNYFGVNFGLGHVFNITDTVSMDLYAKYIWTHQSGEEVRVTDNELVRFEDVDSHRIRAGLKVSIKASDYISPYFGAAYEYEADARAHATLYVTPLNVPGLKGSTGIAEAGITVSTGTAANIDIGVQGHVGKRKGVSGNVNLKFEF